MLKVVKFIKTKAFLQGLFFLILSALSTYLYVEKQEALYVLSDLGVYIDAVKGYQSGDDPYTISDRNLFVYQPLALNLMALVGYKALKWVLLICYALVICLILIEKDRIYWFLGLSVMGFGVPVVVTGNVTGCFHAVLILTLKKLRFGFYIAVFLFSIFKPYFLFYLLIPILLEPKFKRSYLLMAFTCSVYAAIVLFSRELNPQLFDGFLNSLHVQTLLRGDVGIGIDTYFDIAKHGNFFAVIVQTIIFGLILFVGVLSFPASVDAHSKALFLYSVITLSNPRLKEYDAAFAFVALYLFAHKTLGFRAAFFSITIGYAITLLYSHWGLFNLKWLNFRLSVLFEHVQSVVVMSYLLTLCFLIFFLRRSRSALV